MRKLDDVEQMLVELGENEIAEDLCVGCDGELIQGSRACVDDFGYFCAETNEAGPPDEEEGVEMDASEMEEVDLGFVENGVDDFNAAHDAAASKCADCA